VSTDKTPLSSIFFIEFFLDCQTLLYRPHSIPSFRLLDSVSLPGEAIRSVTHQVLAPDRRLFCLFLKSRLSFSPLWPRAQLGVPSPENVQCRAVFTQYARTVVPGPPPGGPVQHLVDSRRGRIASKFFSTAISGCWSGRAGASNQSLRACGQHLRWLAPALPKSIFWPRGTSARRRSLCSGSSCARRPWPACRPAPWSPQSR
jgi:hypothetical protein